MSITNFSGSAISNTYNRLVQTDGTILADGTGSILDNLNLPNLSISGNLYVSGTLYAENTVFVTQSYSSGSNILGDSADDFQTLYGTVRIPTGSLTVTGSTNISGSIIVDLGAIGSGAIDGLLLQNTASATVGTRQRSPSLHFRGASWNDTSGGRSQQADFNIQYVPNSPDGNGSGTLTFFGQASGSTNDSLLTLGTGIGGSAKAVTVTAPGGFVANGAFNTQLSYVIVSQNISQTSAAQTSYFLGKLGVGLTSPTSKLHVKGSGTTSATTAFRVENANASASMVVLDNGTTQIITPEYATNHLILKTNGGDSVLTFGGSYGAGYGRIQSVASSLNIYSAARIVLYNGDVNNNSILGVPYNGAGLVSPYTRIALGGTNSVGDFNIINGKVGIGGVNNPTTTLDVSGSGRFTDSLTITGSLLVSGSASTIQNTLTVYDQLYILRSSFLSDTFSIYSSNNSGISTPGRGQFILQHGGREIIRAYDDRTLFYNGNVIIGSTLLAATAQLQVKGTGTTSATTAFLVENANASSSFQVYDSGVGAFGTDYVDHSYKLNFSTPFNTNTNGIKINNGNGYLTLRVSGDQGYVQTGGLLNLSTNVSTTNLNVSTLNTRDNGRRIVSLFENFGNQYGILSIGTTTKYETTAVTIQAPNVAVTNLLTLRDSSSLPLVNISATSSLATVVVTGSLEVTGGITGSLFGTASYVPTLDEVTTAGNTTTNNVNVGSTLAVGDWSLRSTNVYVRALAGGSENRGYYIGYGSGSDGNGGSLTYSATTNYLSLRSPFNSGTVALSLEGNTNSVQFHNTSGTVVSKFVSSTGNLLIGTTTDAGYKLDVNGNVRVGGTDNYIFGNTGSNYIRFYQDSLLILRAGTAVRFDSNLRIDGNRQIQTTSGTSSYFQFYEIAYDGFSRVIRQYQPFALDTSGVGMISRGDLEFRIDSNNDSTTSNFLITKDSGTELFRIQENGNVGIGTTTPSYKLDVSGSARFTDGIIVTGSTTINGDVTIYGTASVDVLITNYESSSIIYSSGSTKFGDTMDDTHEFTGSLYVTGSVNLGVGDSTPQSVSVIRATETNLGIAIVPNGTGAIMASVPDGTGVGGNSRGQYAVDLQKSRNLAAEIASGVGSVISGGQENKSSNFWTTVGGGVRNYATETASTIAGGSSNNATSLYSTISGGQSNTVSTGTHATVVGGYQNSATGQYSIAGGQSNTASGLGAVALGRSNVASGTGAIAIGTSNTVTYQLGFAGGNGNTVSVKGTAFGGSNTVAGGEWSAAIGSSNSITSTGNSYVIGDRISSTATYAFGTGNNSRAYLTGQRVHASGWFVLNNGDQQISDLIASKLDTLSTAATTTLTLWDGSLIIPTGNNRIWNVVVSTTAVVTSITGTATGVSVGDVYSENTRLTFKKISGVSSLVGILGTEKAYDTSMTTAQMNFSAGASQELALDFQAPTFSGGGSITVRVVSKVQLVEVAY